MDDFLGTSIQYSEQQILLLEQQHAADLQKTVEELIESGFLDSDYEDSTETEAETESEFEYEYEHTPEPIPVSKPVEITDFSIDPIEDNSSSTEIEENIPLSPEDQLSLELWNSQSMAISPRTNPCELTPTPHDLTEFIPFEYLLNKILCDLKSLMILFILIIALPHIIYENTHTHSTQNNSNNMCKYNSNNNNNIPTSYDYSTSIYWFCDCSTNHKPLLNEEEDERDEYNPNMNNNKYIFDIISCKKNKNNNQIYSAKLTRHKLIVKQPYLNTLKPGILAFSLNGNTNKFIKIVKQTLAQTYGKQYIKRHGLITLISSFIGIAAFVTKNHQIDT